MSGFAPKVKTKEIDLAEFDGEGIIKVRGLNTNIVEEITELQQKLEKEGCTNENLINIKVSRRMCKLCIVDAPFEITDEVIGDFPVQLVMKIAEVVGEMDSKFPLE
jgi:hypothetical protein